jgi:hypothetical protein
MYAYLAAYVFVLSGSIWTQTQKLEAANDVVGDSFGSSVGLYANVLAIGASKKDSLKG